MLLTFSEIHIACTGKNALVLNTLLSSLGAKAILYQNLKGRIIKDSDQHSLSNQPKLTVVSLFETKQVTDNLLQQLQPYGTVTTHPLENKEWLKLSLAQFEPMQFGGKLWITSTWTVPPESKGIHIIINPGSSFGTGKHPTTALCLEWLANNINQEKIVIDYGCGSGILGIAAHKLGAATIYCVDNDGEALIAARANAQLNHIDESHLKTFFPKKMPIIQADLLIANILNEPLTYLVSHFIKLIKPQGKIVLSGIMENQLEEILKAYQFYFTFKPVFIKEGWVCLEGVLKG